MKFKQGEILKFKNSLTVKVNISFTPLINGQSFDCYRWGAMGSAVSAGRAEINRRKGKKVCECGRVVGDK